MATHGYESHKGRYLYILDACERIVDEDMNILSEHYQKTKCIRRIFEKYTDYHIEEVKFEPGSKPKEVVQYFVSQMKRLTKDDQIIIYFHGGGSGNGKTYLWSFQKFPSKPVMAYDLIKAIIEAKIDCLILVDAYIPDRFHDLWVPTQSNVEIIAKGETIEKINGKKDSNDPGDFSYQIVKTMQAFVKEIEGRKCGDCGKYEKKDEDDYGRPGKSCVYCEDGKLVKCFFAGYHAPLSLPELLIKYDTFARGTKELSARIRRVDINRGKVTKRFVLLPDVVRESGKIEFFAKRKEVEPKEASPKPGDTEVAAADNNQVQESTAFQDEGLGDMSGVEQGAASELFCSTAPPSGCN